VGRPEWEGRQFDPLLSPALDEMFLGRARDEWVALLGPADCCAEPVLRIEELAAHPQHRARSLWLDDGRPRSLPALVETASLPAGRAPAQGEHGAEILREAGASDAEISALRAAGVVR